MCINYCFLNKFQLLEVRRIVVFVPSILHVLFFIALYCMVNGDKLALFADPVFVSGCTAKFKVLKAAQTLHDNKARVRN